MFNYEFRFEPPQSLIIAFYIQASAQNTDFSDQYSIEAHQIV